MVNLLLFIQVQEKFKNDHQSIFVTHLITKVKYNCIIGYFVSQTNVIFDTVDVKSSYKLMTFEVIHSFLLSSYFSSC